MSVDYYFLHMAELQMRERMAEAERQRLADLAMQRRRRPHQSIVQRLLIQIMGLRSG